MEDPGCGHEDPEYMTHERLVLDVLALVLLRSLYGSQNNTTGLAPAAPTAGLAGWTAAESAGEDSADLSVP